MCRLLDWSAARGLNSGAVSRRSFRGRNSGTDVESLDVAGRGTGGREGRAPASEAASWPGCCWAWCCFAWGASEAHTAPVSLCVCGALTPCAPAPAAPDPVAPASCVCILGAPVSVPLPLRPPALSSGVLPAPELVCRGVAAEVEEARCASGGAGAAGAEASGAAGGVLGMAGLPGGLVRAGPLESGFLWAEGGGRMGLARLLLPSPLLLVVVVVVVERQMTGAGARKAKAWAADGGRMGLARLLPGWLAGAEAEPRAADAGSTGLAWLLLLLIG